MPHGFFTVEQWKRPRPRAKPQWVTVCHLNMGHTLSDAIQTLEDLGKPGFYRIVQTQRMVLVEKNKGKTRLHKRHAGSPESLMRSAEAYAQDGY
jgi:hypothetical protein